MRSLASRARALMLSWSGLAALAAMLVAGPWACNEIPLKTQCEGFTLQVNQLQTNREPIKLDFLWVVDASSSMCQEQAALAESIDEFVAALSDFANVDIRTAVVTTTTLDEDVAGLFNTQWAVADQLPPSCQIRKIYPVRNDAYCECGACFGWPEDQRSAEFVDCLSAPENQRCTNSLDAQRWIAEVPGNLEHLYNLNGSINSQCLFTCGESDSSPGPAADQVCRDYFVNDTLFCQFLGTGQAAGCLEPPATDACPSDLPPVLPAYDPATGEETHGLELFPCIATVLPDQNAAVASLEEGLKAAWLALDPNGPRPLQVCDPNDAILQDATLDDNAKRDRCERRFLRQDAYLIMIFVSDEDDCSIDEGKNIIVDDFNRCALLGDADTPPDEVWMQPSSSQTSDRPLAPVYKYANRFRSLKNNPANVFVAAIVGDAYSPTGESLSETDIAAEREAYFESKTDRTNPSFRSGTYICASDFGRADLGLRYLELVEMFGPHGFTANICSNEGIGPALQDIARELIAEVISICLPRDAKTDESGQEIVTVYKFPTGTDEAVELVQNAPDGFTVRDEPADGACPGSGRAIFFETSAVPLPTDAVQILYEAEGQCGL